MTTAVTNHTGTDITDFTVEQSSTYRTEIFMEQPLLDATKDYVVSCSEFAAPLSEEPMLTYRLAVRDLLTIRRRKIGAAPNSAADTIPPEYRPVLQLNATMKMYTPADFLTFVAEWAAGFSNECFTRGLPADFVNDTIAANLSAAATDINPQHQNSLLSVGITPAGVIQIRGSIRFWRNFYIVPNSYAQQLFGLTKYYILFANTPDPADSNDPDLLIAEGVITTSGIAFARSSKTHHGEHSIFRFLEERMYISLEAGDLALPFDQMIRDGVETKTHNLATFPFETNFKTTIKTENGRIQSAIELEMDTHISRTHFQSKTDPTYSWHLLTSSYMVQNMRLEVFITRRRWNETQEKWYYSRLPLNIHKDGVWNASLKFISVH